MKRNLIRTGVWETNSSSCHSVSIANETKEFVLDSLYPDDFRVINIYGGEFGWEWERYNDAETKANYAAQQFSNNEDILDLIKEVIIEQTGAVDVKFVNLDSGYVDHDSVGILDSDKESLRQFIFNKNSWLFLGNDNSRAEPNFYIVPEYKSNSIVNPEFKYELIIDGYKKTTKFLDKPTDDELLEAIEALCQDVYLSNDNKFDDDNSVFAQIRRDRNNYYQYSYKKKPNLKKNTIYFIKDTWSDARKQWEKEFGSNDWSGELGYRKFREIESELLNKKNSPYVKNVKFQLIPIQ
jgi:hypothetical protein